MPDRKKITEITDPSIAGGQLIMDDPAPASTSSSGLQEITDPSIANGSIEPVGKNIDKAKLTEDLAKIESAGGDYSATNGKSSAAGKYQFLWNQYSDDIKRVTGVRTKDQFLDNPVAQEKFFNYHYENNLVPAVERLKAYNKSGYSDSQLAKLVHFKGEAGAQDYLTAGADANRKNNISIPDYIGAPEGNSDQPAPEPYVWDGAGQAPQKVSGVQSYGSVTPTAGAPQVRSVEDTKDAVDNIASDYVKSTPQGGGQMLAEITNPAGDPSKLGEWYQARKKALQTQLGVKSSPDIANLQNGADHLLTLQIVNQHPVQAHDPEQVRQQIDDMSAQEDQEIKQALPAQKAMIQIKYDLANKQALRNQQYDPTMLGLQKAVYMGDDGAKSDLTKYQQGLNINPDHKVAYEQQGYSMMRDAAVYHAGNGNVDVAKTLADKSADAQQKIENDNPEYFRKLWGSRIGDYAFKNEVNPLYGTIYSSLPLSKDEIAEYGKKVGLSARQISMIRPEDVPVGASWKQQAVQSFFNTFLFKDEKSPGGKFFTGDMPVAQKAMDNWKSVTGEIASGAGMVGGFLADAGVVGAGLKGVKAFGDIAKAAKSYETASNLVPLAVSNYNSAWKRSGELIGDAPEDALKRQVYTAAMGTISTALMSLDPVTALGKEAIGGNATKDLVALLKNSNVEEITTPELKDAIFSTIKKIAKVGGATAEHLNSQVFIMSANQAADNVAAMITDRKHRHGIMDNVAETALTTYASMLVPSLMAGVHSVAAQTPINRDIVSSIGHEPEKYNQAIDAEVTKGTVTPEDAATAKAGIADMAGAVSQVPQHNVDDVPLTDNQRSDYALNLFQEKQLQKKQAQIEAGGNDKAQVDPVKQRISELQKQRNDILAKAGQDIETPKPRAKGDISGETVEDIGKEVHAREIKDRTSLLTKGEELDNADKQMILRAKEHPEEMMDDEIQWYQGELDKELSLPAKEQDKSDIKYFQKRIKEATGFKERFNQARDRERSVATNAEPETAASDTKKIPEDLAQSEKEDISLPSDNSNTLSTSKSEQDGTVKNDEGQQEVSTESRQAEGSGPRTEIRSAADSEGGQQQEEDRVLAQSPAEDIKTEPAPEEQASPVEVVKKKRKFVAEPWDTPATKPPKFKNEKERRRKVIEGLLESDGNVDTSFESAGYTNIGGIWVHPDAIDYYNKLSESAKEALKKNDIKYFDGESYDSAHSGTASSISTDGKTIRGVNVRTNVGEHYSGHDHVAIHEAGHAVWESLPDSVKQLFNKDNPVSDYAKAVKKAHEEGVPISGAHHGEEDFCELFANNGGDLNATIEDARNRNQGTEPSTERRNEVKSEKETSVTKKETQNASTSSKKQQQESLPEGGKPEHARTEQAGSKEAPAETKNSNRPERSEKPQEKVKPLRNQSKKGRSLTAYLKRVERALRNEPQSIEEHILHTMMAMNDKAPERKWTFSSLEKEIPKGSQEKARVRQFASDHPKATPIDVWAHDLVESVGEKHGNMPFEVPDEQEIRNMIIENVSRFKNKNKLLEHLENLYQERAEKEHKAEEGKYDKVEIAKDENGEPVYEYRKKGEEPTEHELAQMYAGKSDEHFEGYDDQGHPVYQHIVNQYDAIDNAALSAGDEQKIIAHFSKYYDEKTGKINYGHAIADYGKELAEGLSEAGKKLMGELIPWDDFEQHSKAIQELITKAEQYEKSRREAGPQGGGEEADTQRESNPEGTGAPPESESAVTGKTETGDKLNQAPNDERSVATNPESESETPATEKRLAEIEDSLLKQRASQKLEATLRTKAEKEGDIASANKHNDNWYKKQEKIEHLLEEKEKLSRSVAEENIKQGWKNTADSIRAWGKKATAGSEDMVGSFPGISPKNVGKFIDKVADLVEKIGNIHAAIYKAIEWMKGEHPDEEISAEHIPAIKDAVDWMMPQQVREPVLSIANEEAAKDIVADITSGKMTYTEALDEVLNDPDVPNKSKGAIINFIDWHLKDRGLRNWKIFPESSDEGEKSDASAEIGESTSIKNATTRLRRAQYGLNEELQAGHKEFGTTWTEAKDKIEHGYDPQTLITELSKSPRPVTDVENAILLHQQNTKEILLHSLNQNINIAAEMNDAAAIAQYKATKARVLDELQQIYDVNKAVGTETARGLSSRRMMVDRKYSLVNMIAEKRATTNDGKPLSEEQQQQIEELHQKIQSTQDAFDSYVKDAESQIIDLQHKALSGKVKDKKSASAKLRELADKIEQANKNTLYSSPIPITPKMIAEAIRVVAAGVEKGEQLVDLVKKAIENTKKNYPGVDERHFEKEINKALIDADILESSKKTKEAKDMSGLFSNGEIDREAVRLKVEADRAKGEFDIQLKRDKEKQLSTLARAQDTFLKWQRAFKLSNPLTMGKLMMAGLTRLTTTPLEDIVGGAYSRLLPQLAKGAIGEGGGLNVSETAKAYKTGLMLGLKDASEIMSKKSHGKSELDVLFGKSGDLPPEAIDFFGQLHSATKAPVKRSAFERSLERRLRRNLANGVDITDPVVQTSVMLDAYKDANRAIFMQDNKVAEGWQKMVRYFGQVDPVTGKAPTKAISTGLQWLMPFVKIPTNIAAEAGMHVYGVPVAVAKLVHAAFTGGIENLPAEQKDIILRNLKKGSLGAAALALGYFNPQNFGGFYQPGKKRDDDDAEAMGMKLFDTKIPAFPFEAPIFLVMQLGATVRRVKDEMVHGEEKGLTEGLWAGALGLAQRIPMADQPIRVGQLFARQKDREYYLGELAKSTVDPALLTYLAKATDPADEGSVIRKALAPENKRATPTTIMEHIKSGLPYFREDLDEKRR